AADDDDLFALAHCSFTPVDLTIAVQRGVSSLMKEAKSSAEPILASMPSLVMASFISGERSVSLIALLILPTTSAGVPAGARTPAQNSRVRSGRPASRAVGTSGSSALRAGLVISSGRILPVRISDSDVEGVGFSTWMRPPRKSGRAAAPPL